MHVPSGPWSFKVELAREQELEFERHVAEAEIAFARDHATLLSAGMPHELNWKPGRTMKCGCVALEQNMRMRDTLPWRKRCVIRFLQRLGSRDP